MKTAKWFMPDREMVVKAVLVTYDITATDPKKRRHIATTIANRLTKNPTFKHGVGFDDPIVQFRVRHELFTCLEGKHPEFPNDLALYRLALKTLAMQCFPQLKKDRRVTSKEFDCGFALRTDEDLRYFIDHGEWPDGPEVERREPVAPPKCFRAKPPAGWTSQPTGGSRGTRSTPRTRGINHDTWN